MSHADGLYVGKRRDERGSPSRTPCLGELATLQYDREPAAARRIKSHNSHAPMVRTEAGPLRVTLSWRGCSLANAEGFGDIQRQTRQISRLFRRRQGLGLGRVDSLDDAEDCRCSPADQQRRLKLDKIGRWAR